MKIPIVLLNYNSSTDCRKCVSFLKRQKNVDLEIIIVDNCSQSNDCEEVMRLCHEQDCTFILSTQNKGYNAGNNIGLRYAADKGYKYAMIANPDMEFPNSYYISELVNIMESKREVAVCGSNIVGLNGERQSPKRGTTYYEELFWFIPKIWKLTNLNQLILKPQNQYCDILMGSCILVRMSFIQEINYFDENVFLYCEEVILGSQVKSNGMKMYYNNDITAIHAHVSSTKGSFIKRHDVYWKSRWYYLTKYSGYSHAQLMFLSLSKKLHYIFKRIQFYLCAIK